jgi:type IV pilus assembly protein PilA
MRTELQAKFLQHLNNKKSEKGFTLVELLVVIIIIGILAAIALPNFLNQGAKAKQTEAKQNIGMTNRVQTVYRSENAGFASSFDKLAMGTLSGSDTVASTTNYSYDLAGTLDSSTLIATAKDTALKAYSGGNSRYTNIESKSVIAAVVCEAISPGTTPAVLATVTQTSIAPICPPATLYTTLGA